MNCRQLLKRKIASLTESESAEVLEYISSMESLCEMANAPDLFENDLIYFFTDGTEIHVASEQRTQH